MTHSTGFLDLLREADISLDWLSDEIERDITTFYKWDNGERKPNSTSRCRIREKLKNRIPQEKILRVLENIEQARFV